MRRVSTTILLVLLVALPSQLSQGAGPTAAPAAAGLAAMVRICRNNRGVLDRRACHRDDHDDSKRLLIAQR